MRRRDTTRDQAEAERFARALDRLETTGDAGPEAGADGELDELVAIASRLRHGAAAATASPRYRSYHRRARLAMLQRLAPARPDRPERLPPRARWHSAIAGAAVAAAVTVIAVSGDRGPLPDGSGLALAPAPPAPIAATEPPPPSLPASSGTPAPAVELAAVATADPVEAARAVATATAAASAPDTDRGEATAAAADASGLEAAATPAAVAPAASAGDGPPAVIMPAEAELAADVRAPEASDSPAPLSLDARIARVETLTAAVAADVGAGRLVARERLHALAEAIAGIAAHVEAEPDAVTPLQAIAFLHAAAEGRAVLADAETSDAGALAAARRVAQDGVITASGYLQHR